MLVMWKGCPWRWFGLFLIADLGIDTHPTCQELWVHIHIRKQSKSSKLGCSKYFLIKYILKNFRQEQNEQVKFYVQYKLIRFAPSNCAEKLYLQREGHYGRPNNEQCSTILKGKDVRNKLITREIRGSLQIVYQNTENHTAGVLWVQVEGNILILFYANGQ